MKTNNYIEKVRRDLLPYKNLEYEELYKNSSDEKLTEIFSTLHFMYLNNFKEMNSRLPTKENPAHYWADNSRELILANDSAKGLQRALKATKYDFIIEEYYEKVINNTNKFLSKSGGSVIPPYTEKIDLYYIIPIFILQNSVEINSFNNSQNANLKTIGKGSYATVHKYKDPFYNKNIVVKKAKNNLDDKEIERFHREFTSMKNLNSPYIVEVYYYDENKNEYYMEHMDKTLDKHIKENNQKLTISKKIALIRQILRAFQYIHSKDIWHRDISPNNILIKNYDDVDVIKIADFGLVKIPESQLTDMWTEFKGYFNDPSLIVDGFHTYNIVHETYALTRIIVFVMTGKVNLSDINDTELKSLIQKGLSSEKEKRFQSVGELTQFFNNLSFNDIESISIM